MRTIILCFALISTFAAAQSAPQPTPPAPRPKQILTPADTLRATAKSAFDAEAAREKSPTCPNANTTYAINMCLAHEDELTMANLKAFAAAIRAMLAPTSSSEADTPVVGPTGTEATPATNTAAFDKAQAAWQAYATAECDAVDTYWRGGTIVNSMDIECSLRMSRARLRELNTAYDNLLRPH